MKNRKENDMPSDDKLFNMFRAFCINDEDCNKAVSDAKKAYSLISKEKLFRK